MPTTCRQLANRLADPTARQGQLGIVVINLVADSGATKLIASYIRVVDGMRICSSISSSRPRQTNGFQWHQNLLNITVSLVLWKKRGKGFHLLLPLISYAHSHSSLVARPSRSKPQGCRYAQEHQRAALLLPMDHWNRPTSLQSLRVLRF